MALFLSQAWFDKVATLNEQAGNLNLPPSLANLSINANISTPSEPILLQLTSGKLTQGHGKDAVATINIDQDTLWHIITNNDPSVALEAFMTGKIRIDGDMSQVLSLQSTKPTPEQKELFKKIKDITEFE